MEMNQTWHSMEQDEVLKHLDVDAGQGLNQETVQSRLEEYGPNRLPERKGRGPLMRFLLQFHNVLIYLLLGAALIAGFMGEWIETAVILAVVLVNVLVSFVQEGKAEKALEGIKNMLSLEALVIRGGKRQTIDSADLVPGDIVLVKSGDKIPADMRFTEIKNLRVEESPLTGESEEVSKETDIVAEDAVLGDRLNMGFSGTTVTYGEAKGVVIATGEQAEIGRINTMISDVEEKTTPLLQKIDHFGKLLSLVILLIAGGFFAFGLLVRGYELDEMFLAAISIVVASIPEGLPAILTITLAVGVQRMAKRHAIIRRLPSVETLGAVSVICSDKTGTLTRNEMTVKEVLVPDALYLVEGTGYSPEGTIKTENKEELDPEDHPVLQRLLQCAKACNNASISEDSESSGGWKLEGSPTEGALVALAGKGGLLDFDPERIDSIPFESEHKYMATLNQIKDERLIFLKGAPERVIERCREELGPDGPREIDRDEWKNRMDETAGRGHRVIACAYRKADNEDSIDHDSLGEDFVLIGLTGIIDPPRDEVIAAIEEAKEAGIRVIMITGDHSVTATAIAGQLGIDVEAGAVSGSELSAMSDDEILEAVMKHSVFVRTSPEHKLKLVEALQKQNLLCGMTGDGVNDAPALKRADIGIAMGIKGTEVTKEAAEMVLTDDNFASIIHAVEEGRTIYDNIKKTILFLLPANGAEAMVIIAALLLGMTLPISPVQILWVNMVSAVTLALALTVEPMEQAVMKKAPRAHDEPILGPEFLWRVVFMSVLSGGMSLGAFTLVYHMELFGGELATARTLAVNMLVIAHTFYLFSVRRLHGPSLTRNIFNNRLSFLLIAVLLGLQLGFTYLPFMQTLFGTALLPAAAWLMLAAAGAAVFCIVEIEKAITRRLIR
ncbi:HAD-IC family P-type ATPase [Spirochaeta dissipatitropha]